MRTPIPELRITRWLRKHGAKPIPFEAECTACADAQFKIKHDKRMEHNPRFEADADKYLGALQEMFEEHLHLVHSGG